MSAPIEIVRAWIDKADHDLGSAKIIFQHIPEYFDTIAFHCQQATEKYIKAILVFKEIDFDRSHDLFYLLELLPSDIAVTEDKYRKAQLLNGFSIQIRYPNKIEYMSKPEIEEAISIAQEFRSFAIEIIGNL